MFAVQYNCKKKEGEIEQNEKNKEIKRWKRSNTSRK